MNVGIWEILKKVFNNWENRCVIQSSVIESKCTFGHLGWCQAKKCRKVSENHEHIIYMAHTASYRPYDMEHKLYIYIYNKPYIYILSYCSSNTI